MISTQMKPAKFFNFLITVFLFSALTSVKADEVKIVAVSIDSGSEQNTWLINVTLQHQDSGWDHYADLWQVEDADGNVLGSRILQHPHVNEQPFTRGLAGVNIAPEIKAIFISAHDKVHGWAKKRVKLDLNQVIDGHLRVPTE